MNYQKDTKNNDIDSYGQPVQKSEKILINKDIYEYCYKKTEKIVTALYMVTDCMDRDDAMKFKVRNLGVETLSLIHKLHYPTSNPTDSKSGIGEALVYIDEILSLIAISNTIGYISDMNTKILQKELTNLSGELQANQSKGNHFTFTLDQNIFELPKPEIPSETKSFSLLKDKRTDYSLSFTNHRQSSSLSLSKGLPNRQLTQAPKIDRSESIIKIIKDKKSQIGNEQGVSIKDISASFTDCSEKTIQRELNSLVAKGKIRKTGAKRWSRYMTI